MSEFQRWIGRDQFADCEVVSNQPLINRGHDSNFFTFLDVLSFVMTFSQNLFPFRLPHFLIPDPIRTRLFDHSQLRSLTWVTAFRRFRWFACWHSQRTSHPLKCSQNTFHVAIAWRSFRSTAQEKLTKERDLGNLPHEIGFRNCCKMCCS